MRFLVTLDYELFFGTPTGTPAGCMIEPTARIAALLERYDCPLTLFVDAGYLDRLRSSPEKEHRAQHAQVARQLVLLAERGHDIQLHVHPHWEDSVWREGRWQIDTRRYRLQDFATTEIGPLVERYCATLAGITGCRPTAYRAGGWCVQPFQPMADALFNAGIRIDSTVYRRGRSTNPGREFDFSNAPDRDWWRFDDDPLTPSGNGRFLEIPISAQRVSPMFYWAGLWQRLVRRPEDRSLGDGHALANSGDYYLRKLTRAEDTVVSVDGARAGYLHAAHAGHRAHGASIFNVMGHPKSLTPRSLDCLDAFLRQTREALEPVRMQDMTMLVQTPVTMAPIRAKA